MSLNQGIQKYRENLRKNPVKKDARKSHSQAGPAQTEANLAASNAEQVAKRNIDTGTSENLPEESEKLLEEAALQREIADELERESADTNKLVKDDCSPVNSTRDQLILEYAPLIKYIAQKIAARLPANIELDDLMSSGVIGLMDAMEKYDVTRDNKFKTYAEFRIRGAILDELRAQDWVPRSVREKAKILERCFAKIEQEKGRQATDDEICMELGITQSEYHELLNQVRSVSLLSYDDVSHFSKADKRALHGVSDHGTKAPTPFNEVNSAYIKKMVSDAIQDLPEKQRLVLSLYYYEDLNLKEIGRVLDVTESRVSQLHTQAILRLKGKLKTHWDEFITLFS
jgi:RNA polymerase sigma factor for flagellar operon FliA